MKNKYLVSTQSYKNFGKDLREVPTQYGYLIETDLKSIIRKLKIPTSTDSPYNERIKPGLRGLYAWKNKIYAASWNTVYRINYKSFTIEDSFSHPLMADNHGLFADKSGLWFTSSLIDTVLFFDWDFRLRGYLPFSNTRLYRRKQKKLLDISKDYRLRGKTFRGFKDFHANHIESLDSNHILVTGRGLGYNRGKILLVNKNNLSFKIWIKGLRGPHDGLFLSEEKFAVTETESSSIAIIKINTFTGPRVIKRIFLPQSKNKFWTRGLCRGPEKNSLLVGKSVWKGDDREASVIKLDYRGNLISEFFLKIKNYPECRIFQIIKSPIK